MLRVFRRVVAATVGVGLIGAAVYKPYHDPVKYKKLQQIRNAYDYIIIGAGTTGSIVARRLAEQPGKPSVLLLEAGGPDDYHPLSLQCIPVTAFESLKTDIDWQFYTEPQQNAAKALIDRTIYCPRGKVCGGSSVLNAMFYVRGHKEDYNGWQQVHGCKGWDYDSLLPYFKKSEDITFQLTQPNQAYRGKSGPQKISRTEPVSEVNKLWIQACKNQGYVFNEDYNGESQDGVSLTQCTTHHGRRLTSFRAYIAPMFRRFSKSTDYNMDILPYAQVLRIATNGRRATAVELIYKGDETQPRLIECSDKYGEIILSAGSVGSPHILMHSGIGPAATLATVGIKCVANIEGVGKNLQDHVMLVTNMGKVAVPRNIDLMTADKAATLRTLTDYLFKGRGWLSAFPAETMLFCTSNAGKKRGLKANDLQIVFGCGADEIDDAILREKYEHDIPEGAKPIDRKSAGYHSMSAVVCGLHPVSMGEITLKSNDPLQYPVIRMEYLQHEYDRECMIDGVLLTKDIMNDQVFQDVGGKLIANRLSYGEQVENEDVWSREAIGRRLQQIGQSMYHQIGTCKMGDVENDAMAVCDERLKVRGFDNLRVVDASVMPSLPSGNTQAACYAIGEKGADMIIQDR